MKAFFFRVVGVPPGKSAPQINQLRWIRRIILRWATPLTLVGCVVLIVAGVYVGAVIVAVLQLWSIASVSLRIRRALVSAVPWRETEHSGDARFGTRLQAPDPVGPARSRFVSMKEGGLSTGLVVVGWGSFLVLGVWSGAHLSIASWWED